MLVRLDDLPKNFSLPALRAEFMQAMSLNEEDFYIEGALKLLVEEDRGFMPVRDETSVWLDVNLWKSYYGVGYERGNIELFVRCAEWLEQRLPGCEVYYGHDVGDENVALFDKPARDKLMEHYRQGKHSH